MKRINFLLAALGWLLCLVSVLLFLHNLDRGTAPSHDLFNADVLYLPAFFKNRYNLTGWMAPYAPCFFPDMLLYFTLNWLIDDLTLAIYAFAAIQYILLLFGICLLFKSILTHEDTRARANRLAVLIGALIALLCAVNLQGNLILLFTMSLHTGVFVLCVYCLALLIFLMNRESPGYLLPFSLFMLTFLGTVSDNMMFVIFVFPATFLLVWRIWRARPKRHVAIAALASIISGSLLGILGIAVINYLNFIKLPTAVGFEPVNVMRALLLLPNVTDNVPRYVINRFFNGVKPLHRHLWHLWLLLTAIYLILPALVRRGHSLVGYAALGEASRKNISFFIFFILLSFLITAAGAVYISVGHYLQFFISRHLIPIHTIPVFALVLYLSVLLGRGALLLEASLAAAVIIACIVLVSRADLQKPFPAFQHPLASCLDRTHLKRGLAHYWSARPVNLFNRSGIHVDHVTENLKPSNWLYKVWEPGNRTYEFVITTHLGRNLILQTLGKPDNAIKCGEDEVFIYKQSRKLPP